MYCILELHVKLLNMIDASSTCQSHQPRMQPLDRPFDMLTSREDAVAGKALGTLYRKNYLLAQGYRNGAPLQFLTTSSQSISSMVKGEHAMIQGPALARSWVWSSGCRNSLLACTVQVICLQTVFNMSLPMIRLQLRDTMYHTVRQSKSATRHKIPGAH